MGFRKIKKMFRDGNVCVTGLRGRGKDMLIANVVQRRKIPYVSNVDYGGLFHKFVPSDFDCGYNTYKNFITGNIKYYKFPFPDGTDVYLSDAGVYYPSQFCNELNKQFPYLATFMALSRHLGASNFHFNVQNLNRCWDKIREQSDQYILCLGCVVIFGIVIQKVRVYDKYQSCVDRVKPFRVNLPLVGSGMTRYMVRLQRSSFEASHGEIKDHILIYRNKSNYNTRIFRDLMLGGVKNEA